MSTSGLAIIDAVEIDRSPFSSASVQLLVGDIAHIGDLQKERSDFIIISAMRGTYNPHPHSVIKTLEDKFGISVEQLAKDKEADLFSEYRFWYSHQLPDAIPYRRVLCIETKYAPGLFGKAEQNTDEIISKVFKGISLLSKELFVSGTVMSVLPNTGKQMNRFPHKFTVEGAFLDIMDNAIEGFRKGLPFDYFKLVIQQDKLQAVLPLLYMLKNRYQSQAVTHKTLSDECSYTYATAATAATDATDDTNATADTYATDARSEVIYPIKVYSSAELNQKVNQESNHAGPNDYEGVEHIIQDNEKKVHSEAIADNADLLAYMKHLESLITIHSRLNQSRVEALESRIDSRLKGIELQLLSLSSKSSNKDCDRSDCVCPCHGSIKNKPSLDG